MKLNIIPDEVNLLLIEDDKQVASVIAEQLNSTRHTKFNITTKTTLKEGLEHLDEECALEENCDVDVILLDLVLPNSHGVDTFLQIQKNTLNIPIVIISAHEDIACKCVGLGAQDYLVKPDIPPALLVRSVNYAIKRNDLESRMRNVIMSSSLGYHMYELKDGELYFTGYNPASNKILKVDNSKYIGKKIQDAFPTINNEVIESYMKAIKGEPWLNQIVSYEDAPIKSSSFEVSAYRTAENQLTVTFEDITEKIKIEEKLKDTLNEYKNLVEVTGASIFGMDFVKQKFTYVNDVMCRTLGYSREELLNMWPTDYLTPRSTREFNLRIEALKRGDYIHNNVEYECIRKDGQRIWVLVTTSYPDIHQPIITANAVAIDITEKKVAEEIIKQRELDAYKLLEGKIQTWKHEINQQEIEREENLQMIDAEILSLNDSNKIEVK